MNRKLLFAPILLFAVIAARGKVRLPHLLADNMVLQQRSEARLWGWGKPEREVKVTVSWSKDVYKTTADKAGKWLVSVKTPAGGYTPLSITFDDGDKLTLNNVYAGEVWVCAGQSNMEMPVRGFDNCPVEGYGEAIATAYQNKGIHYVKIPGVMSTRPLDDADCHWEQVNANTVGDCSAVGFFFARIVSNTLGMPVGLVLANKGGTRVESWLDEANLRKYTDEPLDSVEMVKKFAWNYHRPLLWGNGTFHPILNYTVKGILFYQGCSNVGAPGNQYSDRLKLLVEQWRRDFRLGDLPFYFVQIAPYWQDADGNDGVVGAKLREQQLRAAKIIPNSDIVCTNDLVYPYENTQIHPAQKRPIGERLAFIALNRSYGYGNVWCESPQFKEMTIEGDTCYVRLMNDYGGISRFSGISGFEVAGEDRVFHKAVAGHFWVPRHDPRNETVYVTSPEVKKPVAVRYCFRNFQLGNLANGAGLPLFPFRTDDWE